VIKKSNVRFEDDLGLPYPTYIFVRRSPEVEEKFRYCPTGEGNLIRFLDYREAVILNRITDHHRAYPRSLDLVDPDRKTFTHVSVSSKLYRNCLSPWRVKRWRGGVGEFRPDFGKV